VGVLQIYVEKMLPEKKLVQWLGWDLQTPIVDSRSEDGSFAYEASQLNFKAKLCVVFGYE